MRLGAFYNFFDGEELIIKSIESIRNNVDFIAVIFQHISNFGNKAHEGNLKLLKKLLKKKLIDFYELYVPNLSSTTYQNEIAKRNRGLKACVQNKCTHILGMDADEFYLEKEFKEAKEMIISEEFDATACSMQSYYKKPIYQIIPPEEYSVPFITGIHGNSKYTMKSTYPVVIDPTRGFEESPMHFYHFTREQLQMHHMSYVRKDITSKIMNSSSKHSIENPDKYIEFFNCWEKGIKNMHPIVPALFQDVQVVENGFDIEI